MQELNAADAGDDVIRSFIAIEITDEVRAGLKAEQDTLKKIGANVGWVAPANIHLTLIFLGNIFQAQVDPLARALDETALQFSPFTPEVAGISFFGSANAPHVIWAGIKGSESTLTDIQKQLAGAVRALGFAVEEREFHPHLTLGRVRSRKKADELTSTLALAKNTNYGLIDVRRLLLMQSHLEHQGVRYSVLHTSPLKGAQ